MKKLNIYDVATICLLISYVIGFVIVPYYLSLENGSETYRTNFDKIGMVYVTFTTYNSGNENNGYVIYKDSDYGNVIRDGIYTSQSKSIANAILTKNDELGISKLSDRQVFDSVISTIQDYGYFEGRGSVKNIRNTVVSQIADCDERVLLAGGILSQMGYDVALIIYQPYLDIDAGHMQLGVKVVSTGGFKTIEGYAPIELTSSIPIGRAYMDKYELQIDGLKPTPVIIRYGMGNKAYV